MLAHELWLHDARVRRHEAAHAVLLVLYGAKLVRVIGHRDFARDESQSGSVEYIGDDLTPQQAAIVALAGIAAAQGLNVLIDGRTKDEMEAQRLVGPVEANRLRAEAWWLVNRRDIRSAIRVFEAALRDRPVIGPDAEEIIGAALGSIAPRRSPGTREASFTERMSRRQDSS